MYKFGAQSEKTLKGIHPKLVKVLTTAITDSPFDFTLTDGVRTASEQAALFRKGRDKSGNIVNEAAVVTMRDGYKIKSNHQAKDDGYGYAVDLYPYAQGIDYNDRANRLKTIADHIKKVAIAQGIRVVWGGDWTVKRDGIVDRPHFELRS